MSAPKPVILPQPRFWFALGLLALAFGALLTRAAYLQVFASDYLQAQGDARYLRSVTVAPMRGRILDRNGRPLAISTPVDSVWAQPATLAAEPGRWAELAEALDIPTTRIASIVERYGEREFAYLRRHLSPSDARKVLERGVPGVALLREYRRYYPGGPIFGHVLGFTNVDDQGQEGLELAFNDYLAGTAGRKRVMKDRVGHVVEDVESIRAVEDGHDLVTSIDSRIQYLTFRALQGAVKEHRALAGSAVVLDARTGEVLAMVNEPSTNPNNRQALTKGELRNRAVTDVLEPGSTVKPLTVAMALASGRFRSRTLIDTSPGWWRVGGHTVRDIHDYGELTVSNVIVKSSNIGAAKIAMQLPVQDLLNFYRRVGFGAATGLRIPGEVPGRLSERERWREIEHATLAFGYGLSVTPLQLARAYTIFATDGELLPVTLLKRSSAVRGVSVLPPAMAIEIRGMLEQVTGQDGTARRARVPQYRVAGKTGTVHKLGEDGRYAEKRYQSLFAGLAPVSKPRFVMVVVVDEPRGKVHYGGQVAAPVFSEVMQGALRLENLSPDDLAGIAEGLERT